MASDEDGVDTSPFINPATGLGWRNKSGYRVKSVEWYRDQKLRKRYGLTLRDFDAILASQGGRCAICDTDNPRGRGFHLDHDHHTGGHRAVLCFTCNVLLGRMEINPTITQKVQEYINTWHPTTPVRIPVVPKTDAVAEIRGDAKTVPVT